MCPFASTRGLQISFESLCCACLPILPEELDLVVFSVYCIPEAIFVQLRFAVLLDAHAAVNVTVYFIFCTSFNGLTYLTTPNGDDKISKHQRNDL
jgi:hypothetical protein